MHYVKHFDILGIDTAQVPCIELQGVPNTATEGAVGLFGMNMLSADHEIYVCIGVSGNIYTWIPLKGEGGITITSAMVNDVGELVLMLSNGTTINAGVVAGSGCYVNGVATDINFDSDPQTQINERVKKSGDTVRGALEVQGAMTLPNAPDNPETAVVTHKYRVRETANKGVTGLTIVDGSQTHVEKIQGDTVKSVNLIPIPYVYGREFTSSGVTYTVDDNGVVTANGTATTNNSVYMITKQNLDITGLKSITISGCTGGSGSTYLLNMQFYKGNTFKRTVQCTNGSVTVDLTAIDFDNMQMYVLIYPGIKVTNLKFYPMICEGNVTVTEYAPKFDGLKHAFIDSIKSINADGTQGSIYKLPSPVELPAYDRLLPPKGIIERKTGIVESATGFTEDEIATYKNAIVSIDGKTLVYEKENAEYVPLDGVPKNYTVWNGGSETIVQKDTDKYGTVLTITQTYDIHENPTEAATKAYVNNGLVKKLDKTGGTITGNLVVEGKTDTALGAVISKQGSVIYGLAYENEAYKLGQGTIDENGDFSFHEGEGLPIALRDDSSTFTDGNFVCWSADKNKFVDSGKNPSSLVTKRWKHTVTISGVALAILDKTNGESNSVNLNYEITFDRFSNYSKPFTNLTILRDNCSNTKGIGVCRLTAIDSISKEEYINDVEPVAIGEIDISGYMKVNGLFAELSEHEQGVNIVKISFTIHSTDNLTITDSVYEI